MPETFASLKTKNELLADEFLRLCNFMMNDKELAMILAEKLSREHRTIQQNVWRMVTYLAADYAKLTEGHTDARNEGALALAKMIAKDGPGLPTI